MNRLRPPVRSRQGMTLVELVVALTIFSVIITAALSFMARQNEAFQTGVTRLSALRNLRYAAAALTQDLETLGTNVPDGQPAFYLGDSDVVAFSSDYATNIADDPFAVFHDPDAPNGQVSAPTAGFVIPNTGVSFPDTVYEAAPGIRSPAEVLIFFVQEDTSTARDDDYLLFRRVNANDPEVIARNLLRMGSRPFFAYERLEDDGTGAMMLAPVADSLLPVHHTETVHLSPGDTAGSAMADSVRAVTISFGATNGLTGDDEVTVELSRTIALPNAGLGMLSTCGSAPLLGVGLTATPVLLGGGEPATRLVWSQATDEAGGEGDVVRYVLWRREAGEATWGDPYRAIPAGAATYSYEDAAVSPGTIYEYALAAQDCTPTLSSLVTAGPVIIP